MDRFRIRSGWLKAGASAAALLAVMGGGQAVAAVFIDPVTSFTATRLCAGDVHAFVIVCALGEDATCRVTGTAVPEICSSNPGLPCKFTTNWVSEEQHCVPEGECRVVLLSDAAVRPAPPQHICQSVKTFGARFSARCLTEKSGEIFVDADSCVTTYCLPGHKVGHAGIDAFVPERPVVLMSPPRARIVTRATETTPLLAPAPSGPRPLVCGLGFGDTGHGGATTVIEHERPPQSRGDRLGFDINLARTFKLLPAEPPPGPRLTEMAAPAAPAAAGSPNSQAVTYCLKAVQTNPDSDDGFGFALLDGDIILATVPASPITPGAPRTVDLGTIDLAPGDEPSLSLVTWVNPWSLPGATNTIAVHAVPRAADGTCPSIVGDAIPAQVTLGGLPRLVSDGPARLDTGEVFLRYFIRGGLTSGRFEDEMSQGLSVRRATAYYLVNPAAAPPTPPQLLTAAQPVVTMKGGKARVTLDLPAVTARDSDPAYFEDTVVVEMVLEGNTLRKGKADKGASLRYTDHYGNVLEVEHDALSIQ